MAIRTDARPFANRPPYHRSEQVRFLVPQRLANTNDERFLSLRLMINRSLFGLCYRELMPDLFNSMGPNSGVFIRRLVMTHHLQSDLSFPGDIDLLIIPYEGSSLLMSEVLAVEIKAVRASYIRQGKSPNEFGFTQARALLKAGFPRVAVGHLIVSDASPPEVWRDAGITTIKDADAGTCGPIRYIKTDMMPADLLDRSIGRLKANCSDPSIGYFSAYMSDKGGWYPHGYPVSRNPEEKATIRDAVYSYFSQHWKTFFDTPKWPPPGAEVRKSKRRQER